MIGSDLIRDLNIKKTFIVVDKVNKFPSELIKIVLINDKKRVVKY
jgi:hypothetical protein